MQSTEPNFPAPAGDDALNEAAAMWLARRDCGLSAAEAASFARWRDASPAHVAALRRAEAAQNLLSRLPESPGAAALLAEADALACARPRVIPFSTLWKTAVGLAAAACLVVAFLASRPAAGGSNATYAAAAGQHQTVALADGSTLILNGGSEVEVAFNAAERRVLLRRGEAHFYVAKNPARPFLVLAGTVTVRAVGTAFNVRRQVAVVDVLVTEGKVQVSRSASSAAVAASEPIYLVAGERALIDSVPASSVAAGDPTFTPTAEPAGGQRAPRLMFSDTPMSEVIERFNHYSRLKIEIADPELAARGVGGNFDGDNAEALIALLEGSGAVRVERVSDNHVRLHKAR